MSRRRFQVLEDERPERLLVLVRIDRGKASSVRARIEARADQGGRRVSLGRWGGGIVRAGLRWSSGPGPAELVLIWPTLAADQPEQPDAIATDVARLAADPDAQAAVLAFNGHLAGLGGPPPGFGTTREALVSKVREVHRDSGTWPTQEKAADALGVSARRLRQIARWSEVLAEAQTDSDR